MARARNWALLRMCGPGRIVRLIGVGGRATVRRDVAFEGSERRDPNDRNIRLTMKKESRMSTAPRITIPTRATQPPAISRAVASARGQIDALRARLTGELITAEGADFDEARKVKTSWSTAARWRSCARRDARDVAAAVRFARDHALPLAVRSGGHSLAYLQRDRRRHRRRPLGHEARQHRPRGADRPRPGRAPPPATSPARRTTMAWRSPPATPIRSAWAG